ncbi:MAG: fumarylacetoacetate hydrolase family protein, partial [Planctomycetia bacterium]
AASSLPSTIRTWRITIEIRRGDAVVFSGETTVDRIKRPFADLIGHLCRCNTFPAGAVLLTGTGIVHEESFTLAGGDAVAITIDGVGALANPVVVV